MTFEERTAARTEALGNMVALILAPMIKDKGPREIEQFVDLLAAPLAPLPPSEIDPEAEFLRKRRQEMHDTVAQVVDRALELGQLIR